MNRSRTSFVVLIALSLVVLLVASIFRFRGEVANWLRGNPPMTASQPAIVSQMPVTAPVATSPIATTGKFKPIWGPNFKENDGLGRYVCGTSAFGSYYALQQIQMSGSDIAKGFHLGIVPFQLNDDYSASEKERSELLKSGQLDCFLTTMDSVALNDPGVITAFIDESAGADQVWTHGVKTLNDLKGKRIAFEAGGPSEFFIYYLLNTVKLNPKQDVKLLPQLTIDSAIAMFNEQKADVVVGWEPTIFDAKKSGQLLVSTKDFRPIVDVIVTSREAVADKRSLVDIFHDVWFDAIETQEKDFTSAATAIASWGHPAFTGINPNSASQDLRSLLTNIAQANRADNARAVYTPSVLIDRLRSMRKIWAAAGYSVPTSDITQIIEARFIDAAAKEDHTDIGLPNKLVNGTFSLGSELIRASTAQPAATSTNAGQAAAPTAADALKGAQTVATLPCARFEFVPNSTALQAQSQQDLQQCAVDVLQQNPGLFVRVKGSSAWPGPKGTYSQQQVEDAARSRAQGVVDFLVAQGIKADRFVVEWTLPPQDHWETDDVLKQAQDRYVEITLLSSGL